MFDEIKKHPYVIGGAVLGIIVLFFLVSGSGGGGAVASAPADGESDVAAAEATNQASIMANAQVAAGQLQLAGLKEQIGGSISLATIQAHTADNANVLAAAVAGQQINAEHASVDLANTLSAQTQQRYFQSTETLANINSASTLANTQAIAGALVQQASIASQTTLGLAHENTDLSKYYASIDLQKTQVAAGTQNYATNAARDVATQSWWDKIF